MTAPETAEHSAAIRAAATRLGLTPAEYMTKKDTGLKWCRACQEWRPLADYNPSTSTGDGVRPLCNRHRTPRPPLKHGVRGYQRGCRCTECRTSHARNQARIRAEREADPSRADRAGHGKRTTYNNYGCRCPECQAAQSQHMRAYRLRNQRGLAT
jgi:hypothetical protein